MSSKGLACVVAVALSAAFADDARTARTQWFREAGYGIFVHYLAAAETSMTSPDSVNADKTRHTWNECVEAFDVERFADAAKKTGAGYVFFSVVQGSRHLAAPNEAYDRWLGFAPGEACPKRDLVMDLADALGRRGIPLMLYYTGDGPNRDAECCAKGGFAAPIPTAWVEKWADVLECYARRYGAKVKGWWIDGCYVANGNYGYTPEKLRLYERAIRRGNLDAIVAFNRAEDLPKPTVDPYMPFQDFSAGEKYNLECLPPAGGRLADGEQWHVLTPLGEWWGCPGVKLDTRRLADYLHVVNRDGGVVTLDVMCYWDGSLERSQVNALAGVRMRMAALKAAAAKNAGNLAFLKPVRCLSLRGTRLPMQIPGGREWPSMLAATDGDPATYVRARDEWPWQIEVDLRAVVNFSRVRVEYRPGNFATAYRLSVSDDAATWREIRAGDCDGEGETVVTFPRIAARYVRFAALKPDDAGQRGEQMAVAEIQVTDIRLFGSGEAD